MHKHGLRLISLLIILMLQSNDLLAADTPTKSTVSEHPEAYYRLVEGKQFELCKRLLPIINSVKPGTMLKTMAEPLKNQPDFSLPNWVKVNPEDYKEVFHQQYLWDRRNPKVVENNPWMKEPFESVFEKMISDKNATFYTATFDADFDGKSENLLRRVVIDDSFPFYDDLITFYNDKNELSSKYKEKLFSHTFFLFHGKPFLIEESFNEDHPKDGLINIYEPWSTRDLSNVMLNSRRVCWFQSN